MLSLNNANKITHPEGYLYHCIGVYCFGVYCDLFSVDCRECLMCLCVSRTTSLFVAVEFVKFHVLIQ